MQKSILTAFAIVLISGLAIGVQSSLISAAGKTAGATLTGLLVNFLGGAVAGLIIFVIYAKQGSAPFSGINLPTFGYLFASGLLGIVIITGVAYSLPKIGIAGGLSAIIFGQMVVAVLVDTFGLAGAEQIPLSWTRVGGLVLLALGTLVILPKE